jgi:hypothetical protein
LTIRTNYGGMAIGKPQHAPAEFFYRRPAVAGLKAFVISLSARYLTLKEGVSIRQFFLALQLFQEGLDPLIAFEHGKPILQ